MARTPKPAAGAKPVEMFTHDAKRRNIPTAELQSLAQQAEEREPVRPSPLRPRPSLCRQGRRAHGMRTETRRSSGMACDLKLSPGQVRQLQETGKVELGDAQLTWRGKDTQDWSDLVVQPPPIFTCRKRCIPKAIIADLQRQATIRRCSRVGGRTRFIC